MYLYGLSDFMPKTHAAKHKHISMINNDFNKNKRKGLLYGQYFDQGIFFICHQVGQRILAQGVDKSRHGLI